MINPRGNGVWVAFGKQIWDSRGGCVVRIVMTLAFLPSPQRFLLRYGSRLHYWVGLRREGSGPWKWFNGSLFNNLYVPVSSGEHNRVLG